MPGLGNGSLRLHGVLHGESKNLILVMTEAELSAAKIRYGGHSYKEPVLRESEPAVLVHNDFSGDPAAKHNIVAEILRIPQLYSNGLLL